MGVPCFTYGTLMCPDIMSGVTGARFASVPATLAGYSRHPVAGEPYPGIQRNADSTVKGLLYLDVDGPAIDRLDTFEGDEYTRETVQVILSDGTRTRAQVYVFKHALRHRLQAGDWDFQTFVLNARHKFTARYAGFDRL